MEKRKLGNSDLSVNPIAFGAWAIGGWMWGGNEKNESVKALEKGIEKGLTTIDTAPVYGFGLSEEITGEVIKGKRDKLEILKKCGLRWDTKKGEFFFDTYFNDGKPARLYKYSGKESIIEECENSLRRLGTDYIDLLQIHWPDTTTPFSEAMEAFNILKEQGKIRAAGVSNYSVEHLKESIKYTELVSDQVPYSMVRRDIESELVPYCIQNHISIIAYSPMQRGILTGKISPGHKFDEGDSRPDTPYYKRENIQKINDFLDRIKPIAEQKGVELAQLVLRWTAEQPGITCVLAGARNAEQAEKNALALEINISEEEIDLINKEINQLDLDLN